MANILYGTEVAEALQAEITAKLKEKSKTPCLATLRIGENPADISYETGVTKKFTALGLNVEQGHLPEDCTQENLVSALTALNNREDIHGILLFQPLPSHLNMEEIRGLIAPEKDIDCSSLASMAHLVTGRPSFVPGAPAAVMALLEHYKIPLSGKTVTLIGRSAVVGKPLALLLIEAGATVTICHSKTKNLAETAKSSDILITSAGKPNLITKEFVHPEQFVIDVSTNMVEGKLCGDIHPEIQEIVAGYTPTPRGIGAVTTSIMAKQMITYCNNLS